jgi:teichuronic acid exporter
MTQTQEPTYRQKVLSSFAWMGSTQFLGQLLTWSATILVIRLLEPSDYGVMAMATVFLSFLLMLSDLGIGAAIVQADEISSDDARYIQGFIVFFNVAGLAVTVAGSGLVAAFFNEPRLVPILNALSSCFLQMIIYL